MEPTPHTQVVVQSQGVTKDDLTSLKEVFDAKMSSLRAWGIAALIGGQAVAGLLAALVAESPQAQDVAAAVLRAIS